ncbi:MULTISPECIES: RNA polymerase sigma factor [Streptacidiphilus]|uniref:RNA polymerase sigma factor n=1 Tax=Streptacidiphilus cavernicola TaxID=3342716 RepID=A0ABV6UTF1_9ACTN|nr:hypothetical protein [Streptacidiphilus jeojiense]
MTTEECGRAAGAAEWRITRAGGSRRDADPEGCTPASTLTIRRDPIRRKPIARNPHRPTPGAPMQPTAADPALRGTFLALLRSLATAHALDAEELEQQVWLRAAAERRRSDPGSRLRALTVQEFRRAREEARGRARDLEAAGLLAAARTAADAASPEALALGAEQGRELRAAISRLPARCPDLLAALLELPPMSYRELADELAMPRGSIGPTRSRCLACLRRLLTRQPTAGHPDPAGRPDPEGRPDPAGKSMIGRGGGMGSGL